MGRRIGKKSCRGGGREKTRIEQRKRRKTEEREKER